VTRQLEKKLSIFSKNSPKSCHVKKGQNIYNKAQFESPKHLRQTTFETLKYLQPRFEAAYLGENEIKISLKKEPKMLPFLWATSFFQKTTMSLHSGPIWSP
jgi:hypothetical protein